MVRRPSFGAAWSVLLALVLFGGSARSQPDTGRMATATSLFEAGQALVREGSVEDACPKFEESYRLVPANGTLINLADCYERVGRTASAWLKFREVATKSARDGQDARAAVARKRAADLEPRLSRLRVTLGAGASTPGLSIERDGVVLGSAAIGVAVPVDPGIHRLVARAPGHQAHEMSVTVRGEGKTVDAVIPPLDPGRIAPPPDAEGASGWQIPVGIAAFSLGTAGFLAGLGLGVAAKIEADDADCDEDDFCSPDGLAQREDAVALGNAGTVVGVIGGLVGIAGITIWLIAPGADEGPELDVSLGPASVRLSLDF